MHALSLLHKNMQNIFTVTDIFLSLKGGGGSFTDASDFLACNISSNISPLAGSLPLQYGQEQLSELTKKRKKEIGHYIIIWVLASSLFLFSFLFWDPDFCAGPDIARIFIPT